MKIPLFAFIGTLAFLPVALAAQEISVNSLFSDGAVLQRDKPLQIFGTAAAGTAVTVSLANETATAKADASGSWKAILNPIPAGGPFELTVSGEGQTHRSKDILLGDVWLLAGQSNLVGVMRHYGAPEDLASADFPRLRLYSVKEQGAAQPVADSRTQWRKATTQGIGAWSAIGFLLGRELLEETGVPQGLIVCARGNTSISSWMSPEDANADADLAKQSAEFLKGLADFAPDAPAKFTDLQNQYEKNRNDETARLRLIAKAKKEGKAEVEANSGEEPQAANSPQASGSGTPNLPEALFSKKAPFNNYHGMLNQLQGFPIRGMVWYQGESDVGPAANFYTGRLKAFFARIRKNWAQPELPLVVVQLPSYDRAKGQMVTYWSPIRDAQRAFVASDPHAVLVSTIDIGDPKKIHPLDKRPFASRIAQAIRVGILGETGLLPGAYPVSATKKDGSIVLKFKQAEGGLQPKGGTVSGLEISTDGKTFSPAEGKISGETVIVAAAEPVKAIRYAWQDVPKVLAIRNAAGIPTGSFLLDVSVP